ncbi:hypothetical protein [Kutzneria albida]|uniref:Uncharacterized protein n=1 Tax=Kutzneria albida DSM 43870 TaxID=1449976 RepID=W5W109_9PSEU|nr:hypothetical protein [Kutzneria albida]AHH94522.1 hypothetical protein KALB_1149 [Kutzneria albida DSM 43870]
MPDDTDNRWLISCRDAAGRNRQLVIHVIDHIRIAVQVPAGECAFLLEQEADQVSRCLQLARARLSRSQASLPGRTSKGETHG